MRSSTALLSFVGLLPTVLASLSASSSSNIAIYWGQNSYDQSTGPFVQQRLSYYCANTEFDIIPVGFLTGIADPALNLANAGNNCTTISGSNLFYCPQVEADIAECQTTYGKTILLSFGGSTYTEGGFTSNDLAVAAANNVWEIFGPVGSNSSVPRPFGTSVVDGFDFDFEDIVVSNMPAFANQLRTLFATDTSKSYYLTAAPQCFYPDLSDNPMLNGTVYFDFIWVQFYNNGCGLNHFTVGSSTQTDFNFDTWDTWAHETSLNPNVKVLLGAPANTGAAGAGYVDSSTLADIISYSQTFSSFGGVMLWDMSQLYANPGYPGYLEAIVSDLAS